MIEAIAPIAFEDQEAPVCAVIHTETEVAGELPTQTIDEAVLQLPVIPKPSFSAEDQEIFRSTVAGFGILSLEQRYVRQRAVRARGLGRVISSR